MTPNWTDRERRAARRAAGLSDRCAAHAHAKCKGWSIRGEHGRCQCYCHPKKDVPNA